MKLPTTARVLALLGLLMLFTGCSENKGKIEGTKWVSDAATVKGNSIPQGALALEFRADGGLTYNAGPQTYTGKYSLGMMKTVTLKLDQELSGQKNHAEKVEIKGDKLTMTDSDGTALTFSRVPN